MDREAPIPTKRPVPMLPAMAISWTCRLERPRWVRPYFAVRESWEAWGRVVIVPEIGSEGKEGRRVAMGCLVSSESSRVLAPMVGGGGMNGFDQHNTVCEASDMII